MIALLHCPVNGTKDGFTVPDVGDIAKFERWDLFHAGDRNRASEYESNGALEVSRKREARVFLLPLFHYYIISLFHYSNTPFTLLLEPCEDLLGILVKNLLFLFRRQPRDAFDIRPHVIVPLAGPRIGLGTRSRTFRAKQATSRAHDSKKQLQGLDIVKCGIEIKLL